MQEIQFIAPAALHDEMLRLRNEKQMDFLESLTGMDWGAADEKDTPEKLRGLGVVYHLESTVTGERIAVKTATTNRELPEIPSVSDIWKIADFYEREVFDYYGITFIGHPDMRRLYLRNDWIGYPMRKDNDPEKDNPLCMLAGVYTLIVVVHGDGQRTLGGCLTYHILIESIGNLLGFRYVLEVCLHRGEVLVYYFLAKLYALIADVHAGARDYAIHLVLWLSAE